MAFLCGEKWASELVSWCTREALINSQNRISYVFLSNASS